MVKERGIEETKVQGRGLFKMKSICKINIETNWLKTQIKLQKRD